MVWLICIFTCTWGDDPIWLCFKRVGSTTNWLCLTWLVGKNLRLGQLLLRARQLLMEAKREREQAEQEAEISPLSRRRGSCIFRADWLGMFLGALARGRCRSDVETLRDLLEVHFSKNVLEGNLAVSGVCRRCLQIHLKHAAAKNYSDIGMNCPWKEVWSGAFRYGNKKVLKRLEFQRLQDIIFRECSSFHFSHCVSFSWFFSSWQFHSFHRS